MCTFFGAHFCPNFCEHMSRFFARTPCELPAKPTPYKLLPQGLRIWSNLPESSTLVLFPQGFLLFASVWHENRFRGSENEAMGILSGDATTGGGGRSQLCCISPNPVFKVSQIILRKLCHSIISPCEPRVICWCVTLALNRGGAWLLQSLNWLELLQGSEHFAPWGQRMQVTWGRRGMQSYCALHLPWTLACANVANALKDKIFWQNMKWRTHEVSSKVTSWRLSFWHISEFALNSEDAYWSLGTGWMLAQKHDTIFRNFFVGVPNLYQTPKTILLEPHMQFQVSELQLNVDTWNFCCTANLTYYSYDDEDIDTDLTQFLALGVDWNAFYIKIVHCSHLVLWHIVMNIT